MIHHKTSNRHPGTPLFTSVKEQLAWACDNNLNYAVPDLDKEAVQKDSPDHPEDSHIGEWVADNYLTDFLYTGGLGWMRYDGCRWKSVEETAVSEVIRQTLIKLQYSEAQKSTDNLPRLQQITRMLSANKIRSITYVAKLRKNTEETFDAHPDLLNARNGVIDLKTSKLLNMTPN
jgi:phage/plasmid-associated DNA primase